MANAPDDATYVLTLPDGDLTDSRTIEAGINLFKSEGGPINTCTFDAVGAVGTINNIQDNGIYFLDVVTNIISTFEVNSSESIVAVNLGTTPNTIDVSLVPNSSVQNIALTNKMTTETGGTINIVGVDGINVTFQAQTDGSGLYTFNADGVEEWLDAMFITLSDETSELPDSISLGDLESGILKVNLSGDIGTPEQAIPNTDYASIDATYVVNTSADAPPNAQVLSDLDTGILKVATTTGLLSQAIAGTDYIAPFAILDSLSGLTVSKFGFIQGVNATTLSILDIGGANTAPTVGNTGSLEYAPFNDDGTQAKFITMQDDSATLPQSFSLGSLTTGLLKNTTTLGVGVPSTGIVGDDYADPSANYLLMQSTDSTPNFQALNALSEGLLYVANDGTVSIATDTQYLVPNNLLESFITSSFVDQSIVIGQNTDEIYYLDGGPTTVFECSALNTFGFTAAAFIDNLGSFLITTADASLPNSVNLGGFSSGLLYVDDTPTISANGGAVSINASLILKAATDPVLPNAQYMDSLASGVLFVVPVTNNFIIAEPGLQYIPDTTILQSLQSWGAASGDLSMVVGNGSGTFDILDAPTDDSVLFYGTDGTNDEWCWQNWPYYVRYATHTPVQVNGNTPITWSGLDVDDTTSFALATRSNTGSGGNTGLVSCTISGTQLQVTANNSGDMSFYHIVVFNRYPVP